MCFVSLLDILSIHPGSTDDNDNNNNNDDDDENDANNSSCIHHRHPRRLRPAYIIIFLKPEAGATGVRIPF